ncbi:nicotinamide N-methyltransferase-like [Gastrophryne carolinensis]
MAVPYTPSQTYIDQFNSKDYLQFYYSPEEGSLFDEWTDFALQNFHETFTSGGVKGDTLIDFGSGPTIYQLLSSCEAFNKIIVSDFLEQNRQQLQKWLRKDPDAFDWSPITKAVCKLEGNSDYKKKEEKLRKAVTKVLKCDALKKHPYEPEEMPQVDCLTSCLCLEVPSKDVESFIDILKKLKELIKPGGHIVIQSVINCSFYYVGQTCFYCLAITKEQLEKAFKDAGYEIVKLKVTPRIDKSRMELTDYDGLYYMHARKPFQ